MAEGNLLESSEVCGYVSNNLDPMFRWDDRFPTKQTLLRVNTDLADHIDRSGAIVDPVERSPATSKRTNRRQKDRSAARYKTQPVTFEEITEVDEETVSGSGQTAEAYATSGGGDITRKANFKSQMAGFSLSIEGIVYGLKQQAAKSGFTPSGLNKENTPLVDPDPPTDERTHHLADASISGHGSGHLE